VASIYTSLFIARILGPCLLIVGIGILLNQRTYRQIIEDFCKNTALIFYGGIIALAVGFAIVLNHNLWTTSWRVIITIYGWGGIIKGTWLSVFPNSVSAFMKLYRNNKNLLVLHSTITLIIGAVLTFFGYFAR